MSTTWGYDARGRVVTETLRLGALGTYTATYGYDSQDRVVGMRYPDPTPDGVETGELITTTYNAAGWPAGLTGSLGDTYVVDATYTPEGRPDVLSLGSGLQVDRDYYAWDAVDGRGRLWRLRAGPIADPTSLQNLSYTYDAVGNVQTITDNGQATSFTYDDLDRLTGVGGAYSETYTYNAIGNLTSKTGVGSYTYDAMVGGCSAGTPATKPHAVAQAGSYSFSYDCSGNVITRTVSNDTYGLTYDAENRLQGVTNTTTGKAVAFTYDGDGRRVLRDTITETIAYIGPHYELRFTKTDKPEDLDDDCRATVVDIMQVAAQWGQAGGAEDVNNDGTVDVADIQQVAGVWRETCHVLAETTKYYHLSGRRIAMRREPVGQGDTLYYLFTDHLGSTSVTYNTATGQAQAIRYYPWGDVRSGSVPTDRRFTGQRWDDTIGLYDYNARWYEPAVGRFIQPDALVPNPGNPQDLNRYSYVRNNPLKYTDPTGRWVETLWDLANIAWDIYEIRQNPRSLANWGALVLDVGATLVPFVPAGAGIVVRGGKAVAHAEDILDVVRAVNWTERFVGAGPEVMQGIEWLEKLVKSERVWAPYRRGFAAELLRAEKLFKEGKLRAVEAVVEGGRVDLILMTDEIVEVKYWRQSYASGQIGRLLDQLQRYHEATGRPVILELVQTKTDPITEAFIEQLLKAAREAEFALTREQIRIITLGGP